MNAANAAAPDAAAANERRWRALLLTCGRFDDPTLPHLRSPVRDAEVLGQALADPDGTGYDVTPEVNCTARQAQVAIARFFKDARPRDVLLLYLSCHGVQDARGDLHFAFSDTRREDLDATAVSAEWVRRRLQDSRSRTIIVLIDCCFSGAFLRGMQAKGDNDANVGSLVRDLPDSSGVAVLTASGANEYSLEDAGGRADAAARPSYFTEAVVTGIATGAADLDGNGQITVDELYSYVRQRVHEGPSPQRPQRMGQGEGQIVIATVGRRRPEPPVPPVAPEAHTTIIFVPDLQLAPWPPLPTAAAATPHPMPTVGSSPVPVERGPRPRRRGRWVAFGAVLLLALAGGAGALWWPRTPARMADVHGSASPAVSASGSASTSASATASATASSSPTPQGPPAVTALSVDVSIGPAPNCDVTVSAKVTATGPMSVSLTFTNDQPSEPGGTTPVTFSSGGTRTVTFATGTGRSPGSVTVTDPVSRKTATKPWSAPTQCVPGFSLSPLGTTTCSWRPNSSDVHTTIEVFTDNNSQPESFEAAIWVDDRTQTTPATVTIAPNSSATLNPGINIGVLPPGNHTVYVYVGQTSGPTPPSGKIGASSNKVTVNCAGGTSPGG